MKHLLNKYLMMTQDINVTNKTNGNAFKTIKIPN